LSEKPSYLFDLRESIVAFSLLKITHAFREMQPGECLGVCGCDSDTRREIFKVLGPFNYKIVDTKEKNGLYSITIRKQKSA